MHLKRTIHLKRTTHQGPSGHVGRIRHPQGSGKPSLRRTRGEEGVALVVAIVVAMVVVLLSTAAIEQSVNSITQAGIAGKQVSSTDAAEAGIQSVYHQIVSQAQGQAASFTCPSQKTSLTSTASFAATYTVVCSTVGTPTVACTTCTLSAGASYLIQSTGTTTANTIGTKTLVAQVQVPSGLTATQSGQFPEAIFAGQDFATSLTGSLTGALSVSKTPENLTIAGSLPASTGGDIYTGAVGQCNSLSPWSMADNYYDLGVASSVPLTDPILFGGTCSIGGDVIMDNTNGVSLLGGTGVGGSIWTTGPVSLTGSAASSSSQAQQVGGSITAGGAVTICPPVGYDVVGGGITTGAIGSIYANLTIGGTACGTVNVGGDINVAGLLTGSLVDTGAFGVYANGQITLTNSRINGVLLGETGVTLSNTTVGSVIFAGSAMSLTNVTTPSVQGLGSVTLTGGTYGTVDSVGPLTIQGGATITGTVYAEGGVNFVNGTIKAVSTNGAAIEDEGGTVNCNNNKMGGGLYTYGALVINCTAGSNGPTVIKSYTSPLNSTSSPSGAPDDYPPQSGLGINGVGYYPQGDVANTANSIQAATNAAANTINGNSAATASASPPTVTSPTISFPTLNYDQNSWLANAQFCGSTVACNTSTMNLETTNNCGTGTGSLYADVQAYEQSPYLPTVIQTNCQFNPGLLASGIPMYANLAVFDTAGFTFPSSFTAGFYSGDGKTHQLFLIVPSTLNTTYPTGEATCGLGDSAPDIVVDGPLTDSSDNIQDFLYTPGSICNLGGSMVMYGKAYAQRYVSPSPLLSSWNQTYFNISPWVATPGTSTLLGTPSITSLAQVSH